MVNEIPVYRNMALCWTNKNVFLSIRTHKAFICVIIFYRALMDSGILWSLLLRKRFLGDFFEMKNPRWEFQSIQMGFGSWKWKLIKTQGIRVLKTLLPSPFFDHCPLLSFNGSRLPLLAFSRAAQMDWSEICYRSSEVFHCLRRDIYFSIFQPTVKTMSRAKSMDNFSVFSSKWMGNFCRGRKTAFAPTENAFNWSHSELILEIKFPPPPWLTYAACECVCANF